MSRSIAQTILPLRPKAGSRTRREREVLIRESALVLDGVRSIRLAESDRLPFNR